MPLGSGTKSKLMVGRKSQTPYTQADRISTLRSELFHSSIKKFSCSCRHLTTALAWCVTCYRVLIYLANVHFQLAVGRVSHPDAPEQKLAGIVSFYGIFHERDVKLR